MCLMFTLFYTQMRRVLVEREIKNLQTTFDQAVDDVNTELALHQSMSDYLAFDQTIVQIVKAEDKNSFEAYERMGKEFGAWRCMDWTLTPSVQVCPWI